MAPRASRLHSFTCGVLKFGEQLQRLLAKPACSPMCWRRPPEREASEPASVLSVALKAPCMLVSSPLRLCLPSFLSSSPSLLWQRQAGRPVSQAGELKGTGWAGRQCDHCPLVLAVGYGFLLGSFKSAYFSPHPFPSRESRGMYHDP